MDNITDSLKLYKGQIVYTPKKVNGKYEVTSLEYNMFINTNYFCYLLDDNREKVDKCLYAYRGFELFLNEDMCHEYIYKNLAKGEQKEWYDKWYGNKSICKQNTDSGVMERYETKYGNGSLINNEVFFATCDVGVYKIKVGKEISVIKERANKVSEEYNSLGLKFYLNSDNLSLNEILKILYLNNQNSYFFQKVKERIYDILQRRALL